MAYININLEEVKEGGSLHEPGYALLTVKDVSIEESRKQKTPFANLQLEVNEIGGLPTDNHTPIWESFYFTSASLFRLYNFLKALGKTQGSLKDFASDFQQKTANVNSFPELVSVLEPWLKMTLVGEQFRDEIKIEVFTYNGEERKKNVLAGKYKAA